MTVPTFTLPKSKSAYSMLSPEFQALVDTATEAVKDKPWAAVYFAVDDFYQMMHPSLGGVTSSDAGIESVDANFRTMVAALLEHLGADAVPCSDPFQASVFNNSAFKDYRRLARQYLKSAGGGKAVEAQMKVWGEEHREELDSFTMFLRGKEINGDGPKSLDAILDEWIETVRKIFDAQGVVPHIAVGLYEDGSGLGFIRSQLRSDARHIKFRKMVTQQFEERYLTKFVYTCAVWVAPRSSVRPRESDKRREAICVTVSEDGKAIGVAIPIERDWKSGKSTLGKTEKANRAMVAQSSLKPGF